MLKILWSAISTGNPYELAAIGLGVLLALGASFGAGYATASHGAIKTLATAASTASKAQEKHDQDEHIAATGKSAEVNAGDAKHDAKNLPVYQAIAAASTPTPANPQKSCDVPVDVLKQLNEAGHY